MKPFRLGTTILAISALMALATGDSAAATLEPAPPVSLAGPSAPNDLSTQQAEPQPASFRQELTVGLPDLVAGFFTLDNHLDPGEQFGRPVVVRNLGNGPGKPVRVLIGSGAFTNPRVTDAPGFTCTTEPPGVICRGGQVSAGQHVAISLQAKAPQTPGDHSMTVVVDPQNAVEEQNEQNNSQSFTFHVRPGQ